MWLCNCFPQLCIEFVGIKDSFYMGRDVVIVIQWWQNWWVVRLTNFCMTNRSQVVYARNYLGLMTPDLPQIASNALMKAQFSEKGVLSVSLLSQWSFSPPLDPKPPSPSSILFPPPNLPDNQTTTTANSLILSIIDCWSLLITAKSPPITKLKWHS